LAGSNRDDRPRSDDAVAIRIDSPLPNPWTEEALLRYYPEEDIVQLGPGSFVRLDAELAADVEAARALGSDGSGVPWAVVAGALAAVVLVVLGRLVGATPLGAGSGEAHLRRGSATRRHRSRA
jgi:hypothetical protein